MPCSGVLQGLTVIEMRHVSKVYRRGLIETHALRNLSVDIREGDFVSISGSSGSGKTTLLNIAGLVDTLTGGAFFFDGIDVSKLDDRARSQLRNEKIGFVFQSGNLLAHLDVYDNCDLPLRYRRLREAERRRLVDRALDIVGISALKRRYPSELSGGQQQCVAIARAIVGRPKLILADEPTANLDPLAAQHVLDVLGAIHRRGTTIAMVSHSAVAYTQRYLLASGMIFGEFSFASLDTTASARSPSSSEPAKWNDALR
jgi:putative ABC transport system ATP-binding protein